MTAILPPIHNRFQQASSEPTADDAAEQLEGFFMRRMLAEMRKSVGDGMFSGGYAGEMFQDMLDDAIAEQMASAGTLGVADLVRSEFGDSEAPTNSQGIQALGGARMANRYKEAGSSLHAAPVQARMSSGFGKRVHPVTGAQSFHEGVDLAAAKGTEVAVSGPGVVVRAGKAGSYGNIVVVDHGGQLETRYAHLDEITVKVGQQLASGESVGTVGATGRVTGAHLHFEVRRGGKAVDPTRELGNLDKVHSSSQDKQIPVDR